MREQREIPLTKWFHHRVASLVVVAGLATVLLMSAASSASANHHFYQLRNSECITSESVYGTFMRAQITYQMGTYADEKNNIQGLKMKVRFVPTTAGHNLFRSWESYESKNVTADGFNNRFITVTTPPERADQDWSVQVKLTWNRKWKKDWNHGAVLTWDESFCQTSDPF